MTRKEHLILKGSLAPDGAVVKIASIKSTTNFRGKARKIDLLVSETELTKRKKEWKPIKPHYTKGVLAKYASLVSSAAEGAVTNPK